jgi:hypothetical protein
MRGRVQPTRTQAPPYHADQQLDHGARSRTQAKAAIVQDVHGDLEAATHLAQHVLDGHLDIVEKDLATHTHTHTQTDTQRDAN